MDLICTNQFAIRHARKQDPAVNCAILKRTHHYISYDLSDSVDDVKVSFYHMFDRNISIFRLNPKIYVKLNGVRLRTCVVGKKIQYDLTALPEHVRAEASRVLAMKFDHKNVRQKYAQWLVLHWCWVAKQLGLCRDIRRLIGEMATALLIKDREQLPIGFIKGDRK
jgi:hypothetical protein